MSRRVKLQLDRDKYYHDGELGECDGDDFDICGHGLREYVELPDELPPAIWLVFSDVDTMDRYEITNAGQVDGVSAYILSDTRKGFNKQRIAGRPYVEVQYAVE